VNASLKTLTTKARRHEAKTENEHQLRTLPLGCAPAGF
jgi:hypothetical protein